MSKYSSLTLEALRIAIREGAPPPPPSTQGDAERQRAVQVTQDTFGHRYDANSLSQRYVENATAKGVQARSTLARGVPSSIPVGHGKFTIKR